MPKISIQEKYKNASVPDVSVQQGQVQTSQCITEIDDGQQVMKMRVDADDSFCQSDFDSSQPHEQQSNSESDSPSTSDEESDSEDDEYSDSPQDFEQEPSTSTRQDVEPSRREKINQIDIEMRDRLVELHSLMENQGMTQSTQVLEQFFLKSKMPNKGRTQWQAKNPPKVKEGLNESVQRSPKNLNMNRNMDLLDLSKSVETIYNK